MDLDDAYQKDKILFNEQEAYLNEPEKLFSQEKPIPAVFKITI